MKIRYLVAASAVAFIAANSAQAADVVQYQEASVVTAPGFNWSGFYAGGQIGGSWSDTDYSVKRADEHKTHSPDPSGFIGGLYAGYNFDAGNNVILGIETDFVWSDMDGSSRETFNNDEDIIHDKFGVKQKWLGATRVRVGYAFDRWLPYVAGGVAYGKIRASERFIDVADMENSTSWSDSKTFTGWTIGAGVDYAVTDNVLVRLEYRYTDLGDKTFHPGASARYNVDYKTNDFRVGVAYKF